MERFGASRVSSERRLRRYSLYALALRCQHGLPLPYVLLLFAALHGGLARLDLARGRPAQTLGLVLRRGHVAERIGLVCWLAPQWRETWRTIQGDILRGSAGTAHSKARTYLLARL